MTKTLKSAINALAKTLQEREDLLNSIKEDLDKLAKRQENIEKFVMEWQGDLLPEVPEIVSEKAPFIAWKAMSATEGSTIKTQMQIDDVIIPSIENERKALKASYDEQLKLLEGWMLQRLTEANTSSMSVAGVGRAEKRLETKYSIPDKALFAQWAVDNGASSELTISLRPNSKFMAKVVEENGELPPGVQQTRSYKVCFVKA